MPKNKGRSGKNAEVAEDIEPCCEVCESAGEVSDDGMVLCRFKGMVNREYVCRRFIYDPLKRSPRPPRTPMKIDFTLPQENQQQS